MIRHTIPQEFSVSSSRRFVSCAGVSATGPRTGRAYAMAVRDLFGRRDRREHQHRARSRASAAAIMLAINCVLNKLGSDKFLESFSLSGTGPRLMFD